MLGNDADLRESLIMALRMALPPNLRDAMVKMISSPQEFPVPDPSSISRWRVLIDASFMLWAREHMQPQGHVRYMMMDSSTQGGRDMEIIVIGSIAREHLQDARRFAQDLVDMRSWRSPRIATNK